MYNRREDDGGRKEKRGTRCFENETGREFHEAARDSGDSSLIAYGRTMGASDESERSRSESRERGRHFNSAKQRCDRSRNAASERGRDGESAKHGGGQRFAAIDGGSAERGEQLKVRAGYENRKPRRRDMPGFMWYLVRRIREGPTYLEDLNRPRTIQQEGVGGLRVMRGEGPLASSAMRTVKNWKL